MLDLYPTRVTVDLAAIRHNLHAVHAQLPAAQQICCVVKSNAYGHGVTAVGAALTQDASVSFFAVRDVEEGIALRQVGVKKPILLLLGLIDQVFAELVQWQLTPVIYRLETARAFNEYLGLRELTHPVHLKVDTGMTRLGVRLDQLPLFLSQLKQLSYLHLEGVLAHLADASDPQSSEGQRRQWLEIRQHIEQSGWQPKYWHSSNSLGASRQLYPETNLVRLGLALYGLEPNPSTPLGVPLRPALSWTSQLLDIKAVPAGTHVSYGGTYTLAQAGRVGIIPVGYADGYPRLLSNRAQVLVRGRRVPVAGRVCMDLTMLDLSAMPEAHVGDRVTLLGTDGNETITAEELAVWAETISYEIITRIAPRIPRDYLK